MATQSYALRKESPGTPGTKPSYARRFGLTDEQRHAVELLVAGNNDTRTAQRLNLNRVTVTRWRLYDPYLRTDLNRRRKVVLGTATDATRSLLPHAIAAVREQLKLSPTRGRLGLDFLRHAGIFGRGRHYAVGPDTAQPDSVEEIVDQEIHRRRAAPVLQSQTQNANPTPIAGAEREAVLAEMVALSEEDGTTSANDTSAEEHASNSSAFTSRPDGRPNLRLVS